MITSCWNLNETVAHLIGWAEQFRDEIKFLLKTKDQTFPWHISSKNNWTDFNDKNVEKYQSSDLWELINIIEQINEEIINMIRENKDTDQLNIKHEIRYYGKFSPVTITQMIKMKAHHEWEHIKQIKEKMY
ncbi:DinB family protein [Wocania ichthyoenteri]|uniref:DinB family protein n=1 Tax=Wocania ichthyoenteri TaxID=1230531 RepID=UPI001FCD31F7